MTLRRAIASVFETRGEDRVLLHSLLYELRKLGLGSVSIDDLKDAGYTAETKPLGGGLYLTHVRRLRLSELISFKIVPMRIEEVRR